MHTRVTSEELHMVQENMSVIAGKKLKNHIKNSEFRTQEKFANAMHVDPVTVRRWIAHGIAKIDLIQEIANIFGMSFIDFLTK